MPISVDGEMVERWRAAVKETHERRWNGKGNVFYRAGFLFCLFGVAALSFLAILVLTHAL